MQVQTKHPLRRTNKFLWPVVTTNDQGRKSAIVLVITRFENNFLNLVV